jgi:hypothetical protein
MLQRWLAVLSLQQQLPLMMMCLKCSVVSGS